MGRYGGSPGQQKLIPSRASSEASKVNKILLLTKINPKNIVCEIWKYPQALVRNSEYYFANESSHCYKIARTDSFFTPLFLVLLRGSSVAIVNAERLDGNK